MRTNENLQKDVQNAIKWEPLLHAAEIGVTVKDGIVTLTGTVDNYMKKLEAENATKNVAGVKAIVENIKVVLPHTSVKTDNAVADEVVKALRDNWSVPNDNIQVKVENGWVYLEGKIMWDYQREAAKKSIDGLLGVKGVIDNMEIKSEIHDKLEQKLIENALKRHWSVNADDIKVKVSGTNVTLTGYVNSLYQKEEAGRIAWKTPGVWTVDNRLEIEYDYALT